jgi:hypothetical protein
LIEAVFAAADAQNGAEMVRLHSRDSHVIFVGAGSDTVWPGLPSVTAAIEAAHDGTASTRYGMERCVAFEATAAADRRGAFRRRRLEIDVLTALDTGAR